MKLGTALLSSQHHRLVVVALNFPLRVQRKMKRAVIAGDDVLFRIPAIICKTARRACEEKRQHPRDGIEDGAGHTTVVSTLIAPRIQARVLRLWRLEFARPRNQDPSRAGWHRR